MIDCDANSSLDIAAGVGLARRMRSTAPTNDTRSLPGVGVSPGAPAGPRTGRREDRDGLTQRRVIDHGTVHSAICRPAAA
ncbi:hypothetical protein ACFPM0_13140 [Pseudonocardia sulfidoxydans]|uniref:hypothetical protein n=1 Tax=Pseudonocardia sulfidoxydans TaxID=54011 RepID=UPI003618EB92